MQPPLFELNSVRSAALIHDFLACNQGYSFLHIKLYNAKETWVLCPLFRVTNPVLLFLIYVQLKLKNCRYLKS
uniref:Uncharacterized protein n=1 Tax=Pararge aegeria TaxID=116150 RepID=S4NW83_9NEOP